MTVLDRVYGGPFLALARRRTHPAVLAGLLAAALSLIWVYWLARNGGDLAAQYAWAGFVRQHPRSAYNLSWYGGIHPASYSVLSPYLMAWIGVRTTGALACTAGAALGGLLLSRSGIRRPLAPALCLSLAVWFNLAAGRVTYLLGMMFALAAAASTLDGGARRRAAPATAAVLGTVATLCSPVAGLFIEVLAAALFLTGRRKHGCLLAAGPPVVVGLTSLLFPFSGVQPFPWYAALVTAASAVAVALLVPPAWRTVRAAAGVYAVGVALCWAFPTPIGSNVERLAVLAGGAVLIAAAQAGERRSRRTIATYVAAAGLVAWTPMQPIADLVNTFEVAPTVAGAQSLITELRRLGAEQGRTEVVPLRTHWEASGLAPDLDLARGWNRQADVQRNPLFYDGTLTPASYRTWLCTWSVGFVVLPTAGLDHAGIAEARIISTGQPWLSPVWHDANWLVYRVQSTNPLASSPATVAYTGPTAFTIHLPGPGTVLLRIAWSPWLAIKGIEHDTTPRACLRQSGDWTELTAPRAGNYTVQADYTLDRGTPCRGDGS
jgi:hypothetical protein